jgi:tetratricopeptide (TPR) repeat protein
MKKERILAIIGIVLPVICFFFMATIFDPDTGRYLSTIPPGGETYSEELQNQIWGKILIIIGVLFFFQLFYYITYLSEGIKGKRKTLVNSSIIGLAVSILLLISGIAGDKGGGSLFMFIINMPYIIVFSIVMLIRSFRKPEDLNKAIKTYDQLIKELKTQLDSLPQKLDDYVKKGDEYSAQGNFDVAAGIYKQAAETAQLIIRYIKKGTRILR